MEHLPIRMIHSRDVDDVPALGMSAKTVPKWVLQGAALERRVRELVTSLDECAIALGDAELSRPRVLTALIGEKSTAKSRRNVIIDLLDADEDRSVIGLQGGRRLMFRVDNQDKLDRIRGRLSTDGDFVWGISCVDRFEVFRPTVEIAREDAPLKVKLISYQKGSVDGEVEKLFGKFLSDQKLEFVVSAYSDALSVYGIRGISSDGLMSRLRTSRLEDVVYSVEEMPVVRVECDALGSAQVEDFPRPAEGVDYPVLGVLDDGVAEGCVLEPWIASRSSTYERSQLAPMHGTQVASVAILGDRLQGEAIVRHHGVRVVDSAILPDRSRISCSEQNVVDNIRVEIEKHKDVKVWNLCISFGREIKSDRFSDFAKALDALQKKRGILIVKSAGNSKNFTSKEKTKERISEGADSVLSLTVGAVANVKRDLDYAKIGTRAPFSKVGPGPECIVKPEVSHYGGNAHIAAGKVDGGGIKAITSRNELTDTAGTSFSTPLVASLAAFVGFELGDGFDPLLVKGLIIHNSRYLTDGTEGHQKRLEGEGFGVPVGLDDIFRDKRNEITLVMSSELAWKRDIEMLDFPMPASMIVDGYYSGQIIATLVAQPILAEQEGVEYCQSDIDIAFGTYHNKKAWGKTNVLVPHESKDFFAKGPYVPLMLKTPRSSFACRERQLIEHFGKYHPIKKYAVDLAEARSDIKERYLKAELRWHLNLTGLYRESAVSRFQRGLADGCQKFCLIMTFRSPDEGADLYTEMIRGLDSAQIQNEAIRLRSRVSSRVQG